MKFPQIIMIEEEAPKKINIHAMRFKSLINIRSFCPLAEIQRPVNANEWECKAIWVHYTVPLVSMAASLRLSTGKCEAHNSKMLSSLNDKWEVCAFCISREKTQYKWKCFPSLKGHQFYSLMLTGYLLRWSIDKQRWSRWAEIRSVTSLNCTKWI